MEYKKILIVEDEWIIANDIKDALMEAGYKITGISASGDDAISQVKNDQPDLILMDVVLQGDLTGIETAKMISARYDIPIIFLSAYDNHFLIEQAKQTDNYGYLLKPFNSKELKIAIELALHKKLKKQEGQVASRYKYN